MQKLHKSGHRTIVCFFTGIWYNNYKANVAFKERRAIMKLEHVTIDDMLRSYLKSNFANCNTLVIWPLSMCDSEAEVETIK